jgi:hypothetical protein
VEQPQVDFKVAPPDLKRVIAPDEAEILPQLEQEMLELFDQPR